jgi:hypothetical protein
MLFIGKDLFNTNGSKVSCEWKTSKTLDPVEAVHMFIDEHKNKGLLIPDIGVFDVVYNGEDVHRVGKLYDIITIQHPENGEVA